MADTGADPHFPKPQTPQIPKTVPHWVLSWVRTNAALVLREMATRYGRSPGGYIWAILEPLGMIVILSFGFSLLMRAPSLGTSFILFYATGYLPYAFFQSTSGRAGSALKFSRPLLTYPTVGWFDVMFARLFLNTITSLLIAYLLITGIVVLTETRVLISPGPIIISFTYAFLLGFGVGLVNCVLIGFFPVWSSIWSIITRPLFLASGIIVLYDELPQFAQTLLWWNPLVHVTALSRAGFYSMYQPDWVSHVDVLGIGLTLVFFGMLFMRRYHSEILERN